MSQPVLDVRGLSIRYRTPRGEILALDDVDLDVMPGEIVGLVGESGCGKSTLAAAVMGLLSQNARVASGDITVAGRNVVHMGPDELRAIRGARVGRIPQDPARSLHPTLTIERQFRDAVRAHRPQLRGEELRELLHRSIADVGLADPEGVLQRYRISSREGCGSVSPSR